MKLSFSNGFSVHLLGSYYILKIIILTGMGDDGARGLLEMKEAGCSTLGECEKNLA